MIVEALTEKQATELIDLTVETSLAFDCESWIVKMNDDFLKNNEGLTKKEYVKKHWLSCMDKTCVTRNFTECDKKMLFFVVCSKCGIRHSLFPK